MLEGWSGVGVAAREVGRRKTSEARARPSPFLHFRCRCLHSATHTSRPEHLSLDMLLSRPHLASRPPARLATPHRAPRPAGGVALTQRPPLHRPAAGENGGGNDKPPPPTTPDELKAKEAMLKSA